MIYTPRSCWRSGTRCPGSRRSPSSRPANRNETSHHPHSALDVAANSPNTAAGARRSASHAHCRGREVPRPKRRSRTAPQTPRDATSAALRPRTHPHAAHIVVGSTNSSRRRRDARRPTRRQGHRRRRNPRNTARTTLALGRPQHRADRRHGQVPVIRAISSSPMSARLAAGAALRRSRRRWSGPRRGVSRSGICRLGEDLRTRARGPRRQETAVNYLPGRRGWKT